MPSSSRRPDRVSEAIREEVATFLAEGVKDPRVVGMVTVTGVDVTRDLRTARVFVSVLGSDDEKKATFEGLENLAGHLRGRVGRALRLRSAPEIVFRADESVARAARIETLLAQIKQQDSGVDAPTDAAVDPPSEAPDTRRESADGESAP